MVDDANLARRFETLIANLFIRLEFNAERDVWLPNTVGRADMVIRSRSLGVSAVVEIKLYRSRRVATSTLLNIAAQLESMRSAAQIDKAILVITARLDPLAEAELSAFPLLVIYDFDRLVWQLAGHPDLAAEFDSIIRDAGMFGSGDEDISPPRPENVLPPIEMLQRAEPKDGHAPIARAPRGKGLCTELEDIKPLPKSASRKNKTLQANRFEAKCIECIKYLFPKTSRSNGLSTKRIQECRGSI